MPVPAQVLRARPLAVLATAVTAACLAAGAAATTGSQTANGFSVTASLTPDSVLRGGVASTTAIVRNVTASPVRTGLTIALAGPGAGSSVSYSFVLPPSGSVSIVRSFRVPARAPSGVYTLTVTATNPSGGSARATATATVG